MAAGVIVQRRVVYTCLLLCVVGYAHICTLSGARAKPAESLGALRCKVGGAYRQRHRAVSPALPVILSGCFGVFRGVSAPDGPDGPDGRMIGLYPKFVSGRGKSSKGCTVCVCVCVYTLYIYVYIYI